jgi:hypothetical protein
MSTGGILIERIRSIVRAGASTSQRNLDSVRAPIVSWMINGKPTSYVRSRGSLFSNSTMLLQQGELRKSGRRRSKRIAWRSSLIVLSSSLARRDVSIADNLSALIRFRRANRSMLLTTISRNPLPPRFNLQRHGAELPAIHTSSSRF